MSPILRRHSLLIALSMCLFIPGCPPPVDIDSGGTDASDTRADINNMVDVPRVDMGMGVDTPPTGTCPTAMLGPCNPVTSAGCMTSQGCYTVGEPDGGVTGMCATPGTGGNETPCNGGNDCLQGFACLGMGTGPNHCVKLCCGVGDNDTCRNGIGAIHGATCSVQITGLPFFGCQAATACDWFAQDCANGNSCMPTDTAGTTSCTTPVGTGTEGANCGSGTGAVACARGYLCIMSGSDAGPAAVCAHLCDPSYVAGTDAGTTPDGGVSRACPTGLNCHPVNGTPPNYGVCAP